MSEPEAWLARRPAAGDQHAFEDLLTANRVKLHNVCQTFLAQDTSADDLFQIVSVKLWSEIERGHYNPHRADFIHFASTVARQALAEDLRWRRREKRHAVLAPATLDTLDLRRDEDSGTTVPLWYAATIDYRQDPLNVVIWRETLAEAWATLTQTQMLAVNTYLAKDHSRSGDNDKNLIAAMCAARRRVRPLLAETRAIPLRLH